MDTKIIEFVNQLKQNNAPLSDLIELRKKLNNDTLYIDILELALSYSITNK